MYPSLFDIEKTYKTHLRALYDRFMTLLSNYIIVTPGLGVVLCRTRP